MKVAFELENTQADRLRQEADRLGIAPGDLARAILTDALGAPEPAFSAAVERVLRKNEELYRRLA